MQSRYGYSLDREAVAGLLQCSRRERRKLVDAFDGLASNPSMAGDFSQVGLDGRIHEIFLVDGFVVAFWTDHAVRTVRILLVERT